MDYRVILEKVTAIGHEVRASHQVAISNELSSDEINAEMKKFDKKLNSIGNAVHKIVGYDKKPHTYEIPNSIPRNSKVNKDSFVAALTKSKNDMAKLQDDLKNENYRVVDKSLNKVKTLSNTTRGLFTKAVKDLEEMAAL